MKSLSPIKKLGLVLGATLLCLATSLQADELLKKTGTGNLFMVFGEPDADIKKEKDPLEIELKQIELEEKIYSKASMELVAKHRMREVATWSKLKKEFQVFRGFML